MSTTCWNASTTSSGGFITLGLGSYNLVGAIVGVGRFDGSYGFSP